MAGLIDAHILLRNEGCGGIVCTSNLRKILRAHSLAGGVIKDCASDNRPLSPQSGSVGDFASLSIVPIAGRCPCTLVEQHLSHFRPW